MCQLTMPLSPSLPLPFLSCTATSANLAYPGMRLRLVSTSCTQSPLPSDCECTCTLLREGRRKGGREGRRKGGGREIGREGGGREGEGEEEEGVVDLSLTALPLSSQR